MRGVPSEDAARRAVDHTIRRTATRGTVAEARPVARSDRLDVV